MKYTRTLAAIAWLTVATSTVPLPTSAPTPSTPPASEQPAAVSENKDHEVPVRMHPADADYPATTTIPGATIHATDPELVAWVAWALERYAAAGLDLPALDVWIHRDTSGCQGPDKKQMNGYYARRNGTHVLFVCGSGFTLLHEMAHVWDHVTLTPDVRNAFMEERQVAQWGGVEWSQCGGEHLADVIAWGLSDGPTGPLRVKPDTTSTLTRAFEIATGISPLNG